MLNLNHRQFCQIGWRTFCLRSLSPSHELRSCKNFVDSRGTFRLNNLTRTTTYCASLRKIVDFPMWYPLFQNIYFVNLLYIRRPLKIDTTFISGKVVRSWEKFPYFRIPSARNSLRRFLTAAVVSGEIIHGRIFQEVFLLRHEPFHGSHSMKWLGKFRRNHRKKKVANEWHRT